MGRPGYVSIGADGRTMQVFDEFVKIKGITKTAALSDMMEIYMICQDEELYMELKKKYLGVEVAKQELLERRDSRAFNDYIFMKLSFSYDINGNMIDGHETIKAYQRNEKENGCGYTWFSTNSLHMGMDKNKVKYYNQFAKKGEKVTILFAIADAYNDICYAATVLEIQSEKELSLCPGDAACIPKEFGESEKAKIWIKIKDIRQENNLTARMLNIRSSDANLKQVISSSQYHFGYVYLAH